MAAKHINDNKQNEDGGWIEPTWTSIIYAWLAEWIFQAWWLLYGLRQSTRLYEKRMAEPEIWPEYDAYIAALPVGDAPAAVHDAPEPQEEGEDAYAGWQFPPCSCCWMGMCNWEKEKGG